MRQVLFFFFLAFSFYFSAQNYYLFIGTFTHTDSKGIYVYKFDCKTGKAVFVTNTEKDVVNPSFLSVSKNGKFIYSCTETRTETGGSVSSFSFDKKNGKLTFINKQPSGGANPVYITIHKKNKFVINSNYTAGNITVFEINDDGSIKPFSQEIKLSGSSINKERQEKSHPHSVILSPDHKYLAVPDLGSDKIVTYEVSDKEEQPLKACTSLPGSAIGGSGPRHLAFHPNGKFAYSIEELSGSVQAYSFKKGKLDTLQRVLIHTAETKGPFSASDIHISPDGKFLYAANRGKENNIAIFSIDKLGRLTHVAYQPTLGEIPRNFMIDPSGNYLLVANQVSGSIIIFKRNLHTGLLTDTNEPIAVPMPSCLQMIEAD
ncbi:MAG: lactonase family protein [Bacteroidetes bacterium]|nr:lactonase family protein [Bacteroidota bacterium]